MKPITPTLSVEQKRAQNCYQLAIVPAGFTSIFGAFVVSLLLSVAFDLIGFIRGSSGSFVFLPIMFGGSLLAHKWAVHRVRLAGLSLESTNVEIVTYVRSSYQGEPLHWGSRTLSKSIGGIIIALLLSAAGWLLWHWPFSAASSLQKGLGMLSFGLFSWMGLAEMIFGRSPRVHLDAEGIVAFPTLLWPLISWATSNPAV